MSKLLAAIPWERGDESGRRETSGGRRPIGKEQAPEGDGADGPCAVLHNRHSWAALGSQRGQSRSERGINLDNRFFELVCPALCCRNRAVFQVSRGRRHLCLVQACFWPLPRLYDRLDLLDQQYRLLSGAAVLRRQQFCIRHTEIRAPRGKQHVCSDGLNLRSCNSPVSECRRVKCWQVASQRERIPWNLASGNDSGGDGTGSMGQVWPGYPLHDWLHDSETQGYRGHCVLVNSGVRIWWARGSVIYGRGSKERPAQHPESGNHCG